MDVVSYSLYKFNPTNRPRTHLHGDIVYSVSGSYVLTAYYNKESNAIYLFLPTHSPHHKNGRPFQASSWCMHNYRNARHVSPYGHNKCTHLTFSLYLIIKFHILFHMHDQICAFTLYMIYSLT